MNDLPTPASQGNNQININTTNNPISQLGSISVGKELEPVGVGLEQPGLKDVTAKEIELPKEVVAAGVRTQPTTVQLPVAVTQMGVSAVGTNTVTPAPAVALPLTDDQIALGLKQSIVSSWRWLAEWCARRIKQLHKSLTKQQIDKVTN